MRSIGFICLAAIFCVFKGTIKRKYAWWVFAASLVGFNFMVALSDPVDSSDSSDQEVEVQEVKKDEEARKKQEQKAEAERVAQEKQAEAMRIANVEAEKDKKENQEVSDVTCEKCGAKMIVKMGRYGKYLACPNYPNCKNIKPYSLAEGPEEVSDVKCDACGTLMV